MSSPWLSVIVPTYQGADYLQQALESIRIQNDPDIEVLAIDDGSTDSTWAILQQYAKLLPMRCFQRERIGNWVTNSNFAFQLAQGKWACFLHQDDLWLPGRLDALRHVREQPEVHLWLHPCYFIDPTGRRLGRWTCPLPKEESGIPAKIVQRRLLIQNWVGMPCPMFRTDDVLRLGGMDDRLWFTADWDLWLKLAGLGKTRYLAKTLACFRIHPASQTVRRGRQIADLRQQYRIVQERYRDSLSDGQQVDQIAQAATEINVALAAKFHGENPHWFRLGKQLLRLGPRGWYSLGRDSRLGERVAARLRGLSKS